MKRLTTLILLFLSAALFCMGQQKVNVMVDIENIARGGSLTKPAYKGTETGIVVVQVIVDKHGNVTKVTPGVAGSTTQDSALLSAAEASARKARFAMKEGVGGLSTGNIIYGFGVELSSDNIPGKGVQGDYISIKDLLDYHTDGTFAIQAFYFGMSDPDSLTFFVQEREDELFPIQLADNGTETQDQIAFLQELKGGEPITIKGTLTTITMGKEPLKGFTNATILEMPARETEVASIFLEKPTSLEKPQSVLSRPTFLEREANYFSSWVNDRLRYPAEARRKRIEGAVVMNFTIDEEGCVTNIVVKKSPDPSLEREAVRVVSSSPLWQPAQLDGKPVKYTIRNYSVIFWL